ncbi:MAG TPA: HK97 family phage prohead protease [Chloroflexia bacterium]|jgi:hypothetical protein
MKLERKEFTVSKLELKGDDSGPGSFGMYLATWGNWDRVRPIPERPVKGAFAESLAAFVTDSMILWAHKDGNLPIATVRNAYEDDYGLWVEGDFHSTPEAQEVRTVMKERTERGKSVKASMGYITRKHDYVPMEDKNLIAEGITTGRELKKIDLYEGSIVNIPANPLAAVGGVKSLLADVTSGARSVKGLFEERYAERNNSLYSLFDVLCSVLWDIEWMAELADETGNPFDVPAMVHEVLSEFTARVFATVMGTVAREDGAMVAKSGLSAGTGMAAHLEAVSDAVKGLAPRVQARIDLLLSQKEGRMLSQANVDKLQALRDGLDQVDPLKEMIDELLVAAQPKSKAAEDEGDKSFVSLLRKSKALEIALQI